MIERERMILKYLINKQGLVTKKEIADFLNVSVSTIRDDIQMLKQYLKFYPIEIVSVRGSGIQLQAEKEILEKLRDELNFHSSSELDHSSELIYYLLTYRKNYVGLNELADQFYLSRSAIQAELDKLKPLLQKKHVSLHFSKGKGVKLEGDEKQLRALFSEVVSHQTHILDPYGFKSSYKTIQENVAEYLQLETDTIHKHLKQVLSEIGLSLSDNSFNNLLIHILISIVRIKQGNDLKNNLLSIIEYPRIYEAVKLLCMNLGKAYRVEFSKSEIDLIYQYLVSSNDLIDHEERKSNDGLYQICTQLSQEIIRLVEDIRHFTIWDENTQNNLELHLIPLANRIINQVNLKNPMMNQIKMEYPDAFGIAYMCNSLFKKYFNHLLSEDELAYLAIHIESMIEQEEQAIKTILVCSQGIGVSQLLASRIQTTFSKIKIIDVIAEHSIKDYDTQKVDLCIATFPIETAIPKIIVSPLISKDDCRRIQQFIEEYSSRGIKLFNMIHLECMLHLMAENEQSVIQKVSNYLGIKGYVKDDYYENIMEREQKCSTAIGFRTAIPHASEKTVNESVICVVTLDHCIEWGGDQVDLILFLAIRNEDIKRINLKLRALYQFLYVNKNHEYLLNANSKEEIQTIINL